MPGKAVIGAVAATALMAAGVITGIALHASSTPHAASPKPSPSRVITRARATPSASASPAPATFSGPDGVQARWVIRENDKPGSTAWEIHGSHAGITGFASQVYAQAGQRVTLYVSTSGPSFRAQAFRMGYHHGEGARLVWTSPAVTGQNQPRCPVKGGINMVECDNWRPSLTFTITPAFIQGDYLI